MIYPERHALADSTVFDNCGAVHLVNDFNLLVPGSYVKSTESECVDAGTTSFPISGRGKRVLQNIINGERGPRTENLELENVVVVEGFHVNIVSEARLRDSGVWYCGLDCTLRFGPLQNGVVLGTLIRKHNLVFLEYKPLSLYTQFVVIEPFSFAWPQSPAGTMLLPVINKRRGRKRVYRPSSDHALPREDPEFLWHLRSGHLGKEALEKLVSAARGVRINGVARIDCEYCAKAHATKVVSRIRSNHSSPRPFWRVSWDLLTSEDPWIRRNGRL